jgi:hypothetical protein
MAGAESSMLLALPDPCLLQVLQCLAADDDHRSLFSAARANSRLHQTALMALRSITAHVLEQEQVDSILVYLGNHSQHVSRLELRGDEANRLRVSLHELPPQLQLSSLQLQDLSLQLQPRDGSQGKLGSAAAVAALKQLRLSECELLDDEDTVDEALAAALLQLPAGLEHLSINRLYIDEGNYPVQWMQCPAAVLQRLQRLTYLELGYVEVRGPAGHRGRATPGLQLLHVLSGLVDLRFKSAGPVDSSMLSGMQNLTRLELSLAGEKLELEPGALAGQTKLQHLCLDACDIVGDAAGFAQLLSSLQPLQQLTHLSLPDVEGSSPSASAYAALTASSKLQHLDISGCTLPAGVWQHVFPTGRQLPNFQSLNIALVRQPTADNPYEDAPRLVSCCPGLQSLQLWSLRRSAKLLASLQGLSGLHTLRCGWDNATAQAVQAVCQLTGLRELHLYPGTGAQPGGGVVDAADAAEAADQPVF